MKPSTSRRRDPPRGRRSHVGALAAAALLLSSLTGAACDGLGPDGPAWTVSLPGRSVDRVFAGDSVVVCFGWDGELEYGADAVSGLITAFDAATGRTLWSTPFDAAARYGRNDGSRGDTFSAFGDGVVCLRARDGSAHALDAKTGAELWTRPNVSSILEVATGHTYVVDMGLHVTVLDAGTGGVVRRIETPDVDEIEPSSRLVCGDGREYLAAGKHLFAVDSATGAALWTARLPAAEVELAPVDGAVLASSSDAVVAFAGADGHELWSRAANYEVSPGPPVPAGGLVFTSRPPRDEYRPDGARIARFDAATGEKLGEFATVAFAGDRDFTVVGNVFYQAIGERHYDPVSGFFVDLGYGIRWAESWDSKLVAKDAATGATLWAARSWWWGLLGRPTVVGDHVYSVCYSPFDDEPPRVIAYRLPKLR